MCEIYLEGFYLVSIHDVYRFSQKENRLTALLAFALERQKLLLERFLELFGYPTEKIGQISITLQEREEDSIPDATVYMDKKKMVFIESKLGPWIDANQVIGHIKSGKGRIPLVCITSGVTRPEGISQALEKLSGREKDLIRWISWRQLYQTTTNIPEEIVKAEEVSSLIQSLEFENLVGFTGYESEELKDLSVFVSRYNTVLLKISQLTEDIELSLSSKDKSIKRIRFVRDGRSTGGLDAISFCDYAFSYEDWEDCGYDATRDWVREEGSFAAISFYFDEAKAYIWGRATYGTIDRVAKESWDDILNAFGSKGFTISLLTKEARDFEDLEVDRALERLKKETTKVLDFTHEYDFDKILLQKPNRVVSSLANEMSWILNFFKRKGMFTPKTL